MVFQLLSRGLIYVVFVAVVAVGWLLRRRRMHARPSRRDVVAENLKAVGGALDHPRWQLRLAAVRALGNHPDADLLPRLAVMLGDPDSDVRDAVVEILSTSGAAVRVEIVHELQEGRLDARIAAARVLRNLADPGAIPALMTALRNDESAWVRIPVAQALGKFHTDAVIDALAAALDDPQADVAAAAAEILRQIDSPAALAIFSLDREKGY